MKEATPEQALDLLMEAAMTRKADGMTLREAVEANNVLVNAYEMVKSTLVLVQTDKQK